MDKPKKPMHPNSLKNLDPSKTFNSENAKIAQIKSVQSRNANRDAAKAMALTAQEWSTYKKELKDMYLSGLDVLRAIMLKALNNGDLDTAMDLASKIAPYETPKLQAIEQTNKDVSADALTDEELDRRLRELLDKRDTGSTGDL